ncbi:MAG: XRE family transcriptional regulator [Alkalinema sp. RU_4_3]|nr:XRE family transcriptional regulator [Alkalinema sp. RU_4_3]
MKSSATEKIEDKRVTLSSGNVFADLGFENPEQMILKAELVREISAAIKEKGLNIHQAGEVLGLEPQKVTDLVKGRFGEYPIERLFQYMNALDRDLEIVVKPRAGEEKSGVRVTVVGAIACP